MKKERKNEIEQEEIAIEFTPEELEVNEEKEQKKEQQQQQPNKKQK
ncbi:hypothetical protein [Lysinibacillus sp. ZYM-1]|nr:hypothetical protein [Lysinibacillus sp. ZYM-1]